ncbi:MAG TPA: FAD-dependent monooxygenase [Candidatus Janibacter merdipullorum]|nr:FAD-dependent monooxygenase [Candidatus Janibacter merdipullorum]
MLVAALRRHGSEVHFQQRWVGTRRDGDGYVSTVYDLTTDQTYTIRSRFIVGAGGGRSRVLESAGLAVEGETGLFHAANIWFTADLSKYLARRPGILTFNLHPGAAAAAAPRDLGLPAPLRRVRAHLLLRPRCRGSRRHDGGGGSRLHRSGGRRSGGRGRDQGGSPAGRSTGNWRRRSPREASSALGTRSIVTLPAAVWV